MSLLRIFTPLKIDCVERERNYKIHQEYYETLGYTVDYIGVGEDGWYKTKMVNDYFLEHRHSPGIYFMCDVDVLVEPTALERGIKYLDKHPRSLVFPFNDVDNILCRRTGIKYEQLSKYPTKHTKAPSWSGGDLERIMTSLGGYNLLI